MRIARFVHSEGMSWGVVEGAGDAQPGDLTVAGIAEHPFGDITFTGQRWAMTDVRLVAPILPSKVVCIGKNYADHAAEMGSEVPPSPVIFLKPSTSVIGPGDAIRLPADHGEVHHEAELAVIIGRPARNVDASTALQHVLGYACANDVTDRDEQKTDGQWARAKGHDSFCPLGPWMETDFDPSDVGVRALVNGQVKQDGRTAQLLHDVPELISFMSHAMTLLPGDVILTGTPAGVGPIVDGDSVSIEIEGIGGLINPVRAS